MNTKNEYNKTIRSCFVAYIVQAIVNNFVPLLFVTFQSQYPAFPDYDADHVQFRCAAARGSSVS